MARNVYECMFILDSNRYARNAGGISAKIETEIGKIEGEVLASRLWNEQRLAYTINGNRKGTYWLTYFSCEGEKLTQLQRQFELDENIMRHLIIKIDPRLVDVMVAHARGETIEAPEAEAASEDAKTEAATPDEGKNETAAGDTAAV